MKFSEGTKLGYQPWWNWGKLCLQFPIEGSTLLLGDEVEYRDIGIFSSKEVIVDDLLLGVTKRHHEIDASKSKHIT